MRIRELDEEAWCWKNSMCKGPEARKNLEHLGTWKQAGFEPLSDAEESIGSWKVRQIP